MGKKQMSFTPKGMNRDLSVSKFNPEFAFENRNLRLSTNEGNTMLSWVNERGPEKLEFEGDFSISGTPIGTAIINNLLVLFTTTNTSDQDSIEDRPDFIYLVKYNSDKTKLIGLLVFNGNLKFSVKYPIETLVSYESESILKVYWTDGKNQPRLININEDPSKYYTGSDPINTVFDFIRELKLEEEVYVTKLTDALGEFPAGVIQYALTYFSKYGLESNIFYTTPLQYISHYDRAGSPEDKIANAFKIEACNLDDSFDYVRIYSILRTSLNSPLVKRVQDIKISKGVGTTYLDSDSIVQFYSSKTFDIANPNEPDDNLVFQDIVSYATEHQTPQLTFQYALPASGDTFDNDKKPHYYEIDGEWESETSSDWIETEFAPTEESTDFGIVEYGDWDSSDPTNLTCSVIGVSYADGGRYNVYVEDTVEHNGDTYTVTKIKKEAFYYNNDIVRIRIPSTIEEIEAEAFYGCQFTWILIEISGANILNAVGGQSASDVFDGDYRGKLYIPGSSFNAYYAAGFTSEEGGAENPLFESITEETSLDPRFDDGEEYFYIFKKSDFPNLCLRDRYGNIYTWGANANNTAVMYYYPRWTKIVDFPLYDAVLLCEQLQIDSENVWEESPLRRVVVSAHEGNVITFIDTNTTGDTVDPTHLLYLGGEDITVQTFEQKDNTLFLGNIKVSHLALPTGVKDSIRDNRNNLRCALNSRPYTIVTHNDLSYINTLSCPENTVYVSGDTKTQAYYQGASAFKSGEYYRLGIQFQYKTGKWSEPVWIDDKRWESDDSTYCGPCVISDSTTYEGENVGVLSLPEFEYTVPRSLQETMYNNGYRKMRAVYAMPTSRDRTIVCQGVINPTVYRQRDRDGNVYAQSSWLFRCTFDSSKYEGYLYPKNYYLIDSIADAEISGAVGCGGALPSIFANQKVVDGGVGSYPHEVVSGVWMSYYRSTEIMGAYDPDDSYNVDNSFATMHSPDIEFNSEALYFDSNSVELQCVGDVSLDTTYGDIDIQTVTPTIADNARGFIHKNIKTIGTSALISGNFYEDGLVKCNEEQGGVPIYENTDADAQPFFWPVFMWHRKGSLNNDVTRTNRSAELKKKRISNYRESKETNYRKLPPSISSKVSFTDMAVFNAEEASQIVKVNGNIYQGCVDTIVVPSSYSDFYMVGPPSLDYDIYDPEATWKSEFRDVPLIKLRKKDDSTDTDPITELDNVDDYWSYMIQYLFNHNWIWAAQYVPSTATSELRWKHLGQEFEIFADKSSALTYFKDGVPIKYKSSPHIVIQLDNNQSLAANGLINGHYPQPGTLVVVEIVKPYNVNTLFGGMGEEAFQSATWIPCGPPVRISTTGNTIVPFKWGDCYFQRYECLKTYAYTPEDINQVIEIGSFMLETRVNIDGRYDRNRGQASNLNVSPQNFNLINPVYSQLDNFFSYKILPEDYYKNSEFSNQVTWTLAKQSGADVDNWTNITFASTLELDGSCGQINKLTKYNDQLLAFQDTGISQILYNEQQLTTTEGVPVEIANSGKVTGKRYFSNTIGCSNKWSMVNTSSGIYFMDSNDKSIYLFGGEGLLNLSGTKGFNTWFKKNIPSSTVKWNPVAFKNFVTYYDRINQDILFINDELTLAYNEKFGTFTSFYDYGRTPYFCNLEDTGIWIKPINTNDIYNTELWKHNAGNYCEFFKELKSYSMTLVGNPEPLLDKIFTNLEFRATIEGEGSPSNNKYQPYVPFDSLEAWNEYQHGLTSLLVKDGHDSMVHDGLSSSLLRKFRIWRCDIPRDNAEVTEEEKNMGIYRKLKHPIDRLRNPWIYLKLKKGKDTSLKVEIHDIMMTYFI